MSSSKFTSGYFILLWVNILNIDTCLTVSLGLTELELDCFILVTDGVKSKQVQQGNTQARIDGKDIFS